MSYETPPNRLILLAAIVAVVIVLASSTVPVRASPINSRDNATEPTTIYTCFTDYRFLPPGGVGFAKYRIEYPYSELVSVRVIFASHSDYRWDPSWDLHYLRIIIENYGVLPLYIKWKVCVIYH